MCVLVDWQHVPRVHAFCFSVRLGNQRVSATHDSVCHFRSSPWFTALGSSPQLSVLFHDCGCNLCVPLGFSPFHLSFSFMSIPLHGSELAVPLFLSITVVVIFVFLSITKVVTFVFSFVSFVFLTILLLPRYVFSCGYLLRSIILGCSWPLSACFPFSVRFITLFNQKGSIFLWLSLCSIILHFFLSPTFGCLLKTLMLGVDCFDMLVCFYLCLCATKKARSFWWLLLRWTVCSIFLRVIIAFHYLALFPTFAFSFVPLFCLAFICNDVHVWVFLFCFFTFCTRKKVQTLCDLDLHGWLLLFPEPHITELLIVYAFVKKRPNLSASSSSHVCFFKVAAISWRQKVFEGTG